MCRLGQIGISIYPSRSRFEEDKAYLYLAKKYGFTRVFASLLEIRGNNEEVVQKFKKIIR
ncbi:MupG family TIM beta-alpha barrel fold protein, partial [Kitasatospora sp. SC0581]|uniref:MupG family TIM beta-alpha barrel fold protein n=1 Tax=Kitasatospora sp. SC0581 TaxID=3394360 RepID=UPI003A8ABC4E